MSKFISRLEVARLNETSDVWELISPLVYQSDIADGAAIIVPRGTLTDFASVPRLPLVYLMCGDVGNAAAVVHDHLYQNHMFDRETSDKIYKEALLASGVSWWRAAIMFRGVRLFGSEYYEGGAR